MTPFPTFHYSVVPTAMGEFSIAINASGAVVAAVFGGKTSLQERLKKATLVADPERTAPARRQAEDWFQGKQREFSICLSPEGSPFQHRVWATLAKIPYGETRSYGEVARTIKSSARAVGRAIGTNPICVIVPCHRVIGADGALTGYAFGLAAKRNLLKLEKDNA